MPAGAGPGQAWVLDGRPTAELPSKRKVCMPEKSPCGPSPSSSETVVLVHGYLAHRAWLGLLERRLRRQGFRTVNWGYSTLFRSVREPAARLRDTLLRLSETGWETAHAPMPILHLVVHSMGGIVARAALEAGVPKGLRRMVMLGTPNHGSEVARRLAPLVGAWSPPVRELSAGSDGIVHTLGTPQGLEIGVLAARYDLLVSEASTRPAAPHAFTSLPCSHSGLVMRRDAARQVSYFLANGRFLQEDRARPLPKDAFPGDRKAVD